MTSQFSRDDDDDECQWKMVRATNEDYGRGGNRLQDDGGSEHVGSRTRMTEAIIRIITRRGGGCARRGSSGGWTEGPRCEDEEGSNHAPRTTS